MINKEIYKKYNFDNKDEAENIRNEEMWKQEMFKVYGVEGNPKAEKAYNLAWEYMYIKLNRLEAVEHLFAMYAEVIKDEIGDNMETEFIHASNGFENTICGLQGAMFTPSHEKVTVNRAKVTCPDCLTIINIWKKNGN